jgi:DNA repair protein RecN (Recombination protein N)
MLTELRITNFAIIPHLELEFSPGLVTFTGETGAGKSIILDALESVLGGRTDATFIRSGADRASVEATFRIPPAARLEIHAILEREELLDDPDYLTLGRDIRQEGRNTARVNGRSVNLVLLKELGTFLVDIHGQSEHLSLLNVHQHLGLLDRFADTTPLLANYTTAFHQMQRVRHELKETRQAEQDASRRSDLLTFQAQEIEAARLRPDEEDALRQDRNRLANAENLAGLAQEVLSILDDGSPETPSASDLLGRVVQGLHNISRIDGSLAHLSAQAEGVIETLTDLTRELRDYLEQIEFNPKRLEQVEERLDLIHNLKRKYGGSIDAILAYAADAKKQLDMIAHASERIAELEAEESGLLESLSSQAQALSNQRKKAARQLEKAIEGELNDLNMAGASFAVEFKTRPDPQGLYLNSENRAAFDATGFDRVEFLVAPNPGEGLKPLVKIASGGETSRLMLALKNVLAQADTIATLIFDEIDQGIGGRIGLVIGEKLWKLGRRHQVLCITHLPQLAAFGEQHFRVSKQVEAGRTITQVSPLHGEIRQQELAQMFGGLSDGTLRSAAEILEFVAKQTS